MKKITIKCCLLFICSSFLVCCKKEPTQKTVTTGDARLVRIQQGTDPATDTVYHIFYNNINKIEMITDSTNYVTFNSSYNAKGQLTGVAMLNAFSAEYSYDATGLLTGINMEIAGEQEQFAITYNNGIIAEKKWYVEVSTGGSLSLFETFKYTVTDGNITNIKEYRYDGSLVSDKELRYGFEPNPFRELSLFNFANVLGADEIFNIDTYFNRNILEGYVIDSNSYASNDNLYEGANSDNLTRIEAFVPNSTPEGFESLTWQFFYK